MCLQKHIALETQDERRHISTDSYQFGITMIHKNKLYYL